MRMGTRERIDDEDEKMMMRKRTFIFSDEVEEHC